MIPHDRESVDQPSVAQAGFARQIFEQPGRADGAETLEGRGPILGFVEKFSSAKRRCALGDPPELAA